MAAIASQFYRNSVSKLSTNSAILKRLFMHESRCLSTLNGINNNVNNGLTNCFCNHTNNCQCLNCNKKLINNINNTNFYQRRFNSTQQRETSNDNETENQENSQKQGNNENEEMESETSDIEAEYEAKIEELEKEVTKWKDHAARSQADLFNHIEMSKKDIDKSKKYAVKKFSKEILNVADSLKGAMSAIEKGNLENDEKTKSLVDGVSLTQKTLLETLAKNGITPIECEGQDFDPNFHEALFTVPTNDHPENTVVQVLEDGYLLHERVLRSAKVGISVRNPDALPETSEDTNNEQK